MWVELDGPRPAVVLTREVIRQQARHITVAPISSTARGLSTEVLVDAANGLGEPSVVHCDAIITVPVTALGGQIGHLRPHQEATLAEAIRTAFGLR